MEIWKDINDYEGLYQVSNTGRVKSLDRNIVRNNGYKQTFKEKILQVSKNKNGYYYISLWKDGIGKTYTVHRLVAEAFIPNIGNNPCIDHINTIKEDNRVENLRWCTQQENNNNPLTKEHHSKPYNWSINGWEHWNSKPVLQLSKDGKIINLFPNANSTKVYQVNRVCNGERKTAGGYKWQYVEDYLADWWDKEMDKYID